MRVNAGPAGANEQVLSARNHAVHAFSTQIDGRETWNTDIAAREHPAGQRIAQAPRRSENRVAFWHSEASLR
jgi:hypothetical protein